MNHFDLARSFIERCHRGESIDVLAEAFRTAVQQLGFRYFACWSHVDPLRPPNGAVMLHNYPAVWVHTFSDSQLYKVDPVLLYAERSRVPFFWDDPSFCARLTALQKEILEAAGTFGIAHGYTIPIHVPWVADAPGASCSLVPDATSIDARSYFAAQLMAIYLYEVASRVRTLQTIAPSMVLSARERQCLELAAQGKSDWVIGRLLGLREPTVHTYIERAKRRLGVVTRVQAIVHALAARQICLDDVVKTEPTQGTAGTGWRMSATQLRR